MILMKYIFIIFTLYMSGAVLVTLLLSELLLHLIQLHQSSNILMKIK